MFAVEPNQEMRIVAETMQAGRTHFVNVSGRAEATTLPEHSIDLVTAGPAFHWFGWPRPRFDWAGLKGRFLSTSTVPLPGAEDCEPALAALQAAFHSHAENSRVRFLYTMHVHTGRFG